MLVLARVGCPIIRRALTPSGSAPGLAPAARASNPGRQHRRTHTLETPRLQVSMSCAKTAAVRPGFPAMAHHAALATRGRCSPQPFWADARSVRSAGQHLVAQHARRRRYPGPPSCRHRRRHKRGADRHRGRGGGRPRTDGATVTDRGARLRRPAAQAPAGRRKRRLSAGSASIVLPGRDNPRAVGIRSALRPRRCRCARSCPAQCALRLVRYWLSDQMDSDREIELGPSQVRREHVCWLATNCQREAASIA